MDENFNTTHFIYYDANLTIAASFKQVNNTTMKTIAQLLFCLNLMMGMLFGSSCKEKPCEEQVRVDTQLVVEIEKEPLQSYTGLDTLKFLTNTGDTISFLGQGLNTGFNMINVYEGDYCIVKTITYKQFTGYTFSTLSEYPSDIQYYISIDLNSKGGVYFYIIIDNIQFRRSPIFPPLNNPAYINGLEVNGNLYNNVLKIYKNQNLNEKSYLYFGKEEGIIQVIFSNGVTLTKIK